VYIGITGKYLNPNQTEPDTANRGERFCISGFDNMKIKTGNLFFMLSRILYNLVKNGLGL